MTPRERVLTALRHEQPDRIPFSLGFGINPPAKADLLALTAFSGIDELDAYLRGIDDIVEVSPDYVGPGDRNFCGPDGVRTSIWGGRSKFQSFGAGGYDEQYMYPLSEAEEISDVDGYLFASPDWWDFSSLHEKIRRANSQTQRAVKLGKGNMFETVTHLRKFENILMDTAINKELLHLLLRKVTDYTLGFLDRALTAAKGEADIVFTADDVGAQNGLLMSPDAIQEFIVPYHREINDLVHSFGAKVMFHSCGAVTDAVPMLMDSGIDILESLQFYTPGMHPQILKERFGDNLCFHGGVSVQKTLVTGTPEEVTREVEWLTEHLGHDGGYILAPAHAVQAGTPPENILAMIAAAGRPLPPLR